MSLDDIRAEHVLAALAEFDALGRDAFLEQHGFGRARQYFLIHDGGSYDSKAVVGAAHGRATGHPWRAADFSGGDQTVRKLLESRGFTVDGPTRPERAWSLTAYGEKRDFQGNEGYADVVAEFYRYDSTVANHGRLDVGDLVLVRDHDGVVGVARVDHVEVSPGGEKTRLTCPECGRTGFKSRTGDKRESNFLCLACRAEFDVAATVRIPVTHYAALYGRSWRSLAGALSTAQVEAVAVNHSKQQSIRELRMDGVLDLLRAIQVRVPEAGRGDEAGVTELPGGSRRGLVRVRKGQAGFRRALLERHGLMCAVTGPAPEEALQAAHLRPFAEHERHVVGEGLLLRHDIHTLFDRGLLAVDPASLTVWVHPRLAEYPEYARLAGRGLCVRVVPDWSALAEHFGAATRAMAARPRE